MSIIKVFFIPFAGGSKYSYRDFLNHSDGDLSITVADLPGRGSRLREPLQHDLDILTDDIFDQFKNDLAHPYIIFGHSMGALLGLLLARRIEKERLLLPVHLFFSGFPGPSMYKPSEIHKLPKKLFFETLKKLEGSPKEIFQNDEILTFFEPIIRSDFKALYDYRYKREIKLNIPCSILTGKNEGISIEEITAWQCETSHKINYYEFSGGHFFLFDNVGEILKIIRSSFNIG